MTVEEVGDDGAVKKTHELPFGFSMMLPAFRGVAAVRGIEGLTNPRGFIIVDKTAAQSDISQRLRHRRLRGDRADRPDAGAGRRAQDRLHDRIHGHRNRAQHRRAPEGRRAPTAEATWNAVCLADFGDGGVAFVAEPQIPPRNVNWSAEGKWVHYAKIAFEKYFLRKIRRGESEPFYERWVMEALGIRRLTPRPLNQQGEIAMNIDRAVFAFAGLVVLAGLVLAQLYSPWWLLLSAFAGLNMLQAAFTGFCPAAIDLPQAGPEAGQRLQLSRKRTCEAGSCATKRLEQPRRLALDHYVHRPS